MQLPWAQHACTALPADDGSAECERLDQLPPEQSHSSFGCSHHLPFCLQGFVKFNQLVAVVYFQLWAGALLATH
jgi:hypothetical protein